MNCIELSCNVYMIDSIRHKVGGAKLDKHDVEPRLGNIYLA